MTRKSIKVIILKDSCVNNNLLFYYVDKPADFDRSNFIAGGIVCWNVRQETWSWMVHLDLTTDKTEFKAMIYGSPTVADLDANGQLEVIVGTSLGLLYVLDGQTGFVWRYFPMQFHQIQSQVFNFHELFIFLI